MENKYDEKFLKAVEMVLAHEGGYSCDPQDPGGETKFGISKKSYPDLDIEHLSRDEAIEIYHRDWWVKYGYCELRDEALAAKVFDFAINMGPGVAHTHLQLAVMCSSLMTVRIDGVFGPKTIKACNEHPVPTLLLATLKLKVIRYYADLGVDSGRVKYLRGWIYRALD